MKFNGGCPTCRKTDPTKLCHTCTGAHTPVNCPHKEVLKAFKAGLVQAEATKEYVGELLGVPIVSDPQATATHFRDPVASDPEPTNTDTALEAILFCTDGDHAVELDGPIGIHKHMMRDIQAYARRYHLAGLRELGSKRVSIKPGRGEPAHDVVHWADVVTIIKAEEK